MLSIRNALVIAVVGMAALLTGCGGATVTKTTNTASVGKELEDLKKAYDSGAINQQEYDRARNKILNQRN